MFVIKCDVCKNEIDRENEDSATIEFAYKKYAFCKDCNKPVLKFLKKHKFIKKDKIIEKGDKKS